MSKNKTIVLIMSMLLVYTLTAFSSLPPFNNSKQANAAVPSGTQAAVSADSITMYYLTLPVKDLEWRTYDSHLAAAVVPWLSPSWNVFEDMAICTNNRVHTFIFTYNNITVNGSALLTTWNIECSTYGTGTLFSGYHIFQPKNDININIRSEYYDLFQNGDFSEVTITYMYQANGYKMYRTSDNRTYIYDLSGATLHTREVSPDYDPIEEEGQAPDNGGLAVSPALPPYISFIDKFKEALKTGGNTLIILIITFVVAVIVFRFVQPKK